MRLILVGPSHIPRLRHAIEVVGLPRPAEEISYFGDGGFPIWNKSIFQECRKVHRPGDRILLIVSDFRFGNSILTKKSSNTLNEIFIDGYTHVSKDLCTPKIDEKMKERCIQALQIWKHQFGDDLIIFHWTLAMRTLKNRLIKNHTNTDGIYRHPIWNIDKDNLQDNVKGLSELQTSTDLQACESLTIDNDLHPSTLGYFYINAIAVTADHYRSLRIAKSIYMAGLNSLVSSLKTQNSQKTLITGSSNFLKNLIRAIPLSCQKILEAEGISLENTSSPNRVSEDKSYNRIIHISQTKVTNQTTIEEATENILAAYPDNIKTNVSILFWDSLATQVMQWRARKLRNKPTGMIETKHSERIFNLFWNRNDFEFSYREIDRLVEYGAGGVPTIYGIFMVLASLPSTQPSVIVATALSEFNKAATSHNIKLN